MAPLPTNPDELLQRAGDGDRRALARALSIVERGGPSGAALIRATWVQGRGDGAPEQAFTVGITGAPGAGKSTLSASLCGELLRRDRSVAVLAIDPSSPFSGGAILGDRVRMGDVAGDDDVYIRSMATRGNLGGLAGATNDAVAVLGATGRDWVVVETVGVGQVETDIVDAADTTVVVVNPGWGDAIQANKAGLMEIADVFVVNKSDRDGARHRRRHAVEDPIPWAIVDGQRVAFGAANCNPRVGSLQLGQSRSKMYAGSSQLSLRHGRGWRFKVIGGPLPTSKR
mgnify:CR=1 FL=1